MTPIAELSDGGVNPGHLRRRHPSLRDPVERTPTKDFVPTKNDRTQDPVPQPDRTPVALKKRDSFRRRPARYPRAHFPLANPTKESYHLSIEGMPISPADGSDFGIGFSVLPKRPLAFTLIELLVVVAIIGMLLAILLPSLGRARENSRQSACAANLKMIGTAIQSYAAMEGRFPAEPSPTKPSRFGMWPEFSAGVTGAVDPTDPVAESYRNIGIPGSPNYWYQGQPMGNMWMLVLMQMVQPSSFICRSDPTRPTPSDLHSGSVVVGNHLTYLNFGMINGAKAPTLTSTFSYSFAYTWQPSLSLVSWWSPTANGANVIGADIGPSYSLPQLDPTAAAGDPRSNSQNHGGRGQNVLFADGHADFAARNDVGIAGDNIYTANGQSIYIMAGGTKVNAAAQLNTSPGDVLLAPARP